MANKMMITKDNDTLYRKARSIVNRGFGIEKWNKQNNPTIFSAFKVFQQLVIEDYGKAFYPLSCLYRESQDVIEEDKNRTQHFAQLAFEWCTANQAINDVELWCDLGEMYLRGFGAEKNYDEALKWYRLAADQNCAVAQNALGSMYRLGLGVSQDYKEAIHWHRLAADQGLDMAQFALGYHYLLGQGVPGDNEEALVWYRLAANQVLAEAQYVLGDLYKLGQGVSQDYDEARKWLQLAADQGYEEAQTDLAVMKKICGSSQSNKGGYLWSL